MGFNPLSFITGLFDPVDKILDHFIEDPDKKREAKLAIEAQKATAMQSVMDFVTTQVREQAETIREEIKSGGLAAVWRPITALAFVFIIVYNYFISKVFNLPTAEIPVDLWDVIKIMIGGYVVSRGGEKIVDTWANRSS